MDIGESLLYRNVGASITVGDFDVHGDAVGLSILPYSEIRRRFAPDARKFLSFAATKKVGTLVLMKHTLCGAVQHSYDHCCKYPQPVNYDSVADPIKSGMNEIGESGRHIFNHVRGKKSDYLNMMNPLPSALNGRVKYLPMELAHGLYSYSWPGLFCAIPP